MNDLKSLLGPSGSAKRLMNDLKSLLGPSGSERLDATVARHSIALIKHVRCSDWDVDQTVPVN
jgi:hypothetical protein